jgi:diaminohydroxyphosphoribosylaminopyrimidine deaminase/5-amino-6-(5-phosphoribosylamino)uracil reductase
MTARSDYAHMARALELAGRGLYTTDPNPRVGCVLVNDGRVVGEGWHEVAGGPHAERVALASAGSSASGATAFVTLEPCSHRGRTAPCTAGLIDAGVERVVCAMVDPNPRVSGRGVRALREAGIQVETGILEGPAAELNVGYVLRMRRGRPLVRSKLAVSLDGRTALAGGESEWITGDAARADVHRWRARSSAVLTGVGTILADDPSLDARLPGATVTQPVRVIVDSLLRTPREAKTLSLPGEVIVFTTRPARDASDALSEAGVRLQSVAGSDHCDLQQVMARLGGLEINEVWVEAGPALNGALLSAGLIDELIIYIAPHLLGAGAQGMFETAPLENLDQRWRMAFQDVRRVGADLRIIVRPSTVTAP